MSQRNSQNPVRKELSFKKEGSKFIGADGRKVPGSMTCPACGEEVPPKPGFRMKSLKCPKCKAAMHK
jgi:hypothetical protein